MEIKFLVNIKNYKDVIGQSGDLLDAVKIISKINEVFKSDKVDDNDLI